MQRLSLVLCLLSIAGSVSAQSNFCVTSAVPPIVRAEGLAERIGDILYTCSGVPNKMLTANFTVALNTNISNRIAAGSTLSGIVFTVDSGSGPQPVPVQPLLVSQNTLVFNGVPFGFSPQGSAAFRIAGIRANANGVPVNSQIIASLAVNAAGLLLASSQPVVARPQRGLYAGYASALVCAQNGSPLPSVISFTNLIRANTSLSSIRVTEGFADAFSPRSAEPNFNADSGERILVVYSGFPQDARLFVPDAIAGSDAVQPTAGGDFELPASGGAYAPSPNGSLLLARVAGAGSAGAGGAPVFLPGPIGSGTVTLDSVSEIPIVKGSAYVVYEVVDANSSAVETAQFPTFLGLLPDGNRQAAQTSAAVFFAPVSTFANASATEPLPRFLSLSPPPDCHIIGDCATYLPQLSVDTASFSFQAPAGGGTQQQYFVIKNTGGGAMHWQISIAYTGSGSGWLSVDSAQGVNDAPVRVYASPRNLAPGTYTATLTIDAGADAGTRTIPVSFAVTAPPPATPSITDVLNAASFARVPVVPGSLTTIMGSNFAGKSVSVTFDGMPTAVSFSNSTQINVLVPAGLGLQGSAQLVVTVDGVSSAPRTVMVAPFAPAIFPGAVLNQDGTVNGVNSGASPGSVIQIFATGLSGSGAITGRIHDREITVPYYAGPAPGLPGVQQIDLVVPAGLPAMTTDLSVCATNAAPPNDKSCSVPVQLTITGG